MTEQQQATAKVGDVVIVVRSYGAKPEIDTVVKVTPQGRIRIHSNEGVLFKQDYPMGYTNTDRLFRNYKVYLNTPENMAKLTEEYEKKEVDKQAKEASERERVQKINERQQNELETVKTLLDNKLPVLYTMTPDYNPDETIYILDIPVKPEYVDRKGSHEILIVKVKKEEKRWGSEAEFMGYATWTNKTTSSFASQSGVEGMTADEIVWKCVQSRYFDSW